jgi:hypothetical protein|tara:strand:+ start:286 stop:624 length:339 start_codon:yes stop_codon:yes gene_type:complete
MKLEYNEIKTIHEENIEFEENEVPFTADIIKTDYVPINFEGTTKNFCLRENHPNSQYLHNNFKNKILTEWLIELGYDTELYFVHFETNEIIKKEIPKNPYAEDVPFTESKKI